MTDKQETEEDIKARSAYALYVQGKYAEAFAIYAEILKKDPNHYPSLLGYAEEITRRGIYKEALNVMLRVLVHYGMTFETTEESERAGKLFSKLLGKAGSTQYLLQLMQNSNSKGGAEALDFLARTAMHHGELTGSIELYRATVKNYPEGVKFTNNLIDAMEALNQYAKAFEAAKWFLQTYPMHEVGAVNCEMILKAWQEGIAVDVEEKPASTYQDEQLDLINFYYKIVKLLYVTGDLKAAAALVATIRPAKNAGGDLHLTHIRNANSYFGYIDALIAVDGTVNEAVRKDKKILHVLGDSHVLSPAWRSLQLQKKGEILLKPLLITGCKIWHLRKESDFYTKVNFFQLLKEIPKQGEVIFMLGEIDCREGILEAMTKGVYAYLEEGIKAMVDIYQETLLQVAFQKRLKRLYVHPVPPVLNETRWIVVMFNRALSAKLIALRQRDPKTPLRWLHIESEILNLGKETLKDEYRLDGSHLHPSYITLIEQAINTLEEYE